MTMTTTKTLILSARVVAGLLIGTGTAMADGSDVINDYQAAKVLAALPAQTSQLQAGSSDLSQGGWQFGPFHAAHTPGRATVGGDGAGG
jgi:hypothetical protein